MAALLGIALHAAGSPRAGWEVVEEHWYVLELGGDSAGYSSTVIESDGERFRTTSESRMRFRRADAVAAIESTSHFIESADADPIELSFDHRMSKQAVNSVWRFTPEGVEVVMRQGRRETTRQEPSPAGVWLTPRAVQRYFNDRREAGAETITYRTLNGENGLTPVSVTMERVGEDEYELGGRSIPVTVWNTSSDVIPIPMREMYSSDGHLVAQELEVAGLGTIVTRVAGKAEALAAGRGRPPELLVQTFVPIDPPLAGRANGLETMRLRLIAKNGELPALPSVGAQRVEPCDDGGSAMLTIDIDDGLPAEADEVDAPEFRESTAMVTADDALVAKLAARATRRAADDDWKKAELLRRAVHKHITRKGLETAFATAAETARTRTGDCSEHAVLLCAMMRAADIPSRVATGLVYVDEFAGARGIFAWHMWTQAMIDGKWYDFDATLSRRYHAGHVLVATASLADTGSDREMSSLLLLMGNLEIEVIDATYE